MSVLAEAALDVSVVGERYELTDPARRLVELCDQRRRPKLQVSRGEQPGGVHLTYHGCLAAASPVRDHVVPLPPSSRERTTSAAGADPNQPVPRRRYYTWAELLERVFGTRVLICPRCGAARHMIATITDPAVIRRILMHLKLPPDPLPIAPAREPALFW